MTESLHHHDDVSALLEALKSVNPPLERLMEERMQLRRQIQTQQAALAVADVDAMRLRQICGTEIPRYLGHAKTVSITAITGALIAVTISLFGDPENLTNAVPLLASSLIPLWLVDRAESRFGHWHIHLARRPSFVSSGR